MERHDLGVQRSGDFEALAEELESDRPVTVDAVSSVRVRVPHSWMSHDDCDGDGEGDHSAHQNSSSVRFIA